MWVKILQIYFEAKDWIYKSNKFVTWGSQNRILSAIGTKPNILQILQNATA